MPPVGFDPAISVLKWAKAVHALDRSATVIGRAPRILTKLTNSVALVRERTIPTELPLLVGEVSANFCG
jgi:hypothetical protein